jgi:hypothetical protein
MKIETKHLQTKKDPSRIEKTEKTYKLFGIVVLRKTYYYPESEHYNVVTNI